MDIKKLLPGVVLLYLLTLVSRGTAHLISPVLELEALTIGILLSILIAGLVRLPESLTYGVNWSQKSLLAAGVVLLGFRLNFQALAATGPKVLFLVMLFAPGVIFVGVLLGKLIGVNIKLATLIGVGTAICGSSAVAALAPSLDADQEDAILAVSVVSILGAVGVIIYSAVAVIYRGADLSFGVWSGLTLHNVAHAMAAAYARGEAAGEIGTVVKLARVTMLVFAAPCLGFLFKSGNSRGTGVPPYVLYFLFTAVAGSLLPIPQGVADGINAISSTLITMALVAMGLTLNFGALRTKGVRTLLVGTVLFGIASLAGLFLSSGLF